MYSWSSARFMISCGMPWSQFCASCLSLLSSFAPLHTLTSSLRHLEYYRGILFLTTNRVKIIDDAFRSRIHVALYFNDLDATAKAQVWNAFLAKVNVTLNPEEVRKLAMRDINGRQIKNAVRTATSLAHGRKETLSLTHFLETLDAMDDFNAQFNALASMYN